MAAAVLESLSVPRPRFDLGITKVSMPARSPAAFCRELGFMAKPIGLRILHNHRRISPAAGSAARRGAVVCEAQDTATEVPDVAKETWQSLVTECTRPVVVEFWAPWCGPCRVIHPVLAKLAKTYEGRLDCFKINTDECPDIASQYGVRSIPTMIMFKNGEKKDAIIGAVPESTLVGCIEKFLER